jgi:signal transduction histidine kinase
VSSGERALDAARLLPPECILLDVSMPGMDGFDTCRALLQLPELAGVPVIFLTAHDDTEHKLRGFAAGGRDYVAKPFQAQEVLARVKVQVECQRMAREIREQNARLAAANAQLEQLNLMRARTSAMLVHDLKSPLMVIGSLLETPDDCELHEYARAAHAKLLSLVQEVLELSRNEHQASAQRPRVPVDLNAIVNETVNGFRATARQKSLGLELQPCAASLTIIGDAGQLDRVLSNLLDNAFKFTPNAGRIHVATGTEQGKDVERGLEFATLSVTDTGPGIPAQDLPYIFDLYQQQDAGLRTGSVGLGLAIVQRLVAGHGGRVRVFSQLGVGTTFRVLLPLVRAP